MKESIKVYLRFESTPKPTNSTEEIDSDKDAIAEEHLNELEIQNTAQRRKQLMKQAYKRYFYTTKMNLH